MHFKRDDLCGLHYKWNHNLVSAANLYSGQPSRRLFDRFNGDQVLFLINFYCSLFPDDVVMRRAKIAEWEITHHLPVGIKSELSVFNWLNEAAMQNA